MKQELIAKAEVDIAAPSEAGLAAVWFQESLPQLSR